MAKMLDFPYEGRPKNHRGPAIVYSFDCTSRQPDERKPRAGFFNHIVGAATAFTLVAMGPAYCKMPFVRSKTAEEQLLPVSSYMSL